MARIAAMDFRLGASASGLDAWAEPGNPAVREDFFPASSLIEELLSSDVVVPFVASVFSRRQFTWLPEGRARSKREAIVEGLRQAALLANSPMPPGEPAPQDITVSIDDAQWLLSAALKTVIADGRSMGYVEGSAAQLEQGMRVYSARVDLSLGADPW